MLEKNGIATKTCVQCKKEKKIDNFYLRSRNKDGRENKCKDCRYNLKKKICELCAVVVDENFLLNFNTRNYEKIHGFCRNCRKRLRKYQEKFGGKRCLKCEESKPFGSFPFHKKTYDGFDSWCKDCRKNYRYEVKQSLDTHIRSRLSSIKKDKRKLECDIDLKYLVNLWEKQNGLCAISKEKMSYQRSKREQNQKNGSIDRINSCMGYVKGNVQWVCWTINRMKGEHSLEELLDWCEKILKLKK